MNIKYLAILGISIIVVAAVATIYMMSTYANNELQLRTIVADSSVEKRLDDVLNSINNFPGSAGKDMLFLRSLSSLTDLTGQGDTEAATRDLQSFVEKNEAYDAFFIFNGGLQMSGVYGKEMSNKCHSISEAVKNAVAATSDISLGEVYVSPMYSISCPDLELPISAILYATKIFDNNGSSTVVVGMVNADYFLEDVRRSSRDKEMVYLVQADGAYLANPDRTKEWVVNGESNFYSDYPALPEKILTDSTIKHYDTNNQRFAFLRIVPSMSNFILYDGLSSSDDMSAYWILIVVSEEDFSSWGSAYGYMFMILGSIVLYGLLAWALILMRSLSGVRYR